MREMLYLHQFFENSFDTAVCIIVFNQHNHYGQGPHAPALYGSSLGSHPPSAGLALKLLPERNTHELMCTAGFNMQDNLI